MACYGLLWPVLTTLLNYSNQYHFVKGKRGEGYFLDEQIHIFCMGKFARLLVEMDVDYKYEVSCLNLVG